MRHRSKSLVQTIASDVPSPYDHPESAPKPPKLKKAKSISQLYANKSVDKLSPFSPGDLSILQDQYLTTHFSIDSMNVEDYVAISQQQYSAIHNFLTVVTCNTSLLEKYRVELANIQKDLNHIESDYLQIQERTREFNEQASKLMTQETELNAKFQEINTILKNFESLNEITKKLSIPNNSKVIKSKLFGKILNDLNNSLNFINDNEFKNFKNIDTYKIKFRQCMTKCLTMIQSYLIGELNKLSVGIKTSTNDDQELINIAIYSDFEAYITHYQDTDYSFPKLIDIFLIRIIQYHENEYKGLLLEIFKTYFSVRLGLSNLDSEITKFTVDDLVKYTQDNLSFLKRLLPRELILFQQFFGFQDIPDFVNAELYNYFKDLIDSFYDNFRIRVMRESSISVLCQLTTLLQSYYEYEENNEEVNLQEMLNPILFEVQSRLIFRIQLYIDNKLIPYKPKAEDLALGQSKLAKVGVLDNDFEDNLFPNIYLPLAKALTILSQIYELINSLVFDDLAHYVVHSGILILKNMLPTCETHFGSVESKLYYMKNLIALKYHINSFDIQYVRNDITFDFTSGLNELYTMFRRGEVLVTLTSSGFFNMIRKAVPKVINNMMDAKLEVELELNNITNELLAEYLNILILDLQPPLYDFAKFKLGIKTHLDKFKHQIITYINDSSILRILYENLSEILVSYYTELYRGLDNGHVRDFMEPEIFTRFLRETMQEVLEDEEQAINIEQLLRLE